MSSSIKIPKKLIEVALPLDDINAACAHEKMPGIGPHPRGIHLWWARRPLAAARAIIFAQMVNDPGGERGWTNKKTKVQSAKEREELFDIIRDLVEWKNTNNEAVLSRARAAIRKSWQETCHMNKGKAGFDPEKLPALHDPFAGGGAIPLEAQRLGLESYASDLNPVAVMINKAMIEIPPKFVGQKPVGPLPAGENQLELMVNWKGVQGLAEDVRRYGHWVRKEAFKRIGHLYPKVKVTADMVSDREDLQNYAGKELKVIAWIWARTVKSPNPAFNHAYIPLVSTFILSSKKGKESWVEPIIVGDAYKFVIRTGPFPKEAKKGTKLGRGAKFNCLLSNTPISPEYIYAESQAGHLKQRLMAIVAEGKRSRVYIEPVAELEDIAKTTQVKWSPKVLMPENPRWFSPPMYGMKSYGDLFTTRQLVALTTFSDLVQEVRKKVIIDAKQSGMLDEDTVIDEGGTGATAYGDAIAVYLSFVVDRCADFNNSLTGWRAGNEKIMYLFSRQAIPMVWDFGEANIMENVVGSFITNLEYQVKCLLKVGGKGTGFATQKSAIDQNYSSTKIISTDPPYYDNIGYADLSDFFYVWMRRSLKDIYPGLFSTMAVPKEEELVATPYRHGGKNSAEAFFLTGMTKAIKKMAETAHPAFPVSIYYAFKQSETKFVGTSSAGWETFLEAIMRAGFSIAGTWPIRSEQSSRIIGVGTNALASSVVLICKKRGLATKSISRRQFLRELREKMPEALEAMLGGEEGVSSIAPVDLAQAAIGPGIAIFSDYEAVLNQDGSKMSVHDALILINRAITEYLNPDSGNFDADTLFCDDWFSQYGWGEGPFGEANVLAQAKGTTVKVVADAGVLVSGEGKVRLLKWSEYPLDWDPKTDKRTPIWEACHQIIRVLNQQGETEAGSLLARMSERGETIRQLAYHLYAQCEKKKWAEEARAYNELIGSWHAIVSASHEVDVHSLQQLELDF
jgi:putative DNA methylase